MAGIEFKTVRFEKMASLHNVARSTTYEKYKEQLLSAVHRATLPHKEHK